MTSMARWKVNNLVDPADLWQRRSRGKWKQGTVALLTSEFAWQKLVIITPNMTWIP